MIVRLEGVSYRYPAGVLALKDINLVIPSREALALVGENGAGKTTLARHLNGLLRPQSGRVHVGDWDTATKSVAQLARRVGFVFQNADDQLFARTVREEVEFGPRNIGQSPPEISENVEAALASVDLADVADRHPYDLPTPKRKFVALAATLAMRTPVVILDEPTMGQDAGGVRLMGKIVETLKDEGKTVIVISHDIDFCGEHFDRIVVMSRGQILADGQADAILTQPHVLAQAHVYPPQLIALAMALGLQGAPMNVEDFLSAYSDKRRPSREEA